MQKERAKRRNLEEEVHAEVISGHKVCVYCRDEIQCEAQIQKDKFGNEIAAYCPGECYESVTGRQYSSKKDQFETLISRVSTKTSSYNKKRKEKLKYAKLEEHAQELLIQEKALKYEKKYKALFEDCKTAFKYLKKTFGITELGFDDGFVQYNIVGSDSINTSLTIQEAENNYLIVKTELLSGGSRVCAMISFPFWPILFAYAWYLGYNSLIKDKFRLATRYAIRELSIFGSELKVNSHSIYSLIRLNSEKLDQALECLSETRDKIYSTLEKLNEAAQKYEDFDELELEIQKIAQNA